MCCHSEVVLGLLLDHGSLRIEQDPFVDPVHACTTRSRSMPSWLTVRTIFARLAVRNEKSFHDLRYPFFIRDLDKSGSELPSFWPRPFRRWIEELRSDYIPCGCCLRWIGLSVVCYSGETCSSYYGTFEVHDRYNCLLFILPSRQLTHFSSTAPTFLSWWFWK